MSTVTYVTVIKEYNMFSKNKNKNKNNFILHRIVKITNSSCQLFINETNISCQLFIDEGVQVFF